MEELVKEPGFAQRVAPGLILLAWLAGIMGLLAFAVAWLLHLTAMGASGIAGAILSTMDQALPLSPFSALLDLAKTYAVQACAALAMAWCLDWLVRKWWKPGPERWVRFFNVAAHATIPLAILMLIPVLGMLAAAVFACIILYRLTARLYAPGHWARVVGSLVLSSIPAALSAMLLGLALGFIINPIEARDPFDALQRHLEQAGAEKDMAQALAQMAPTPAALATQIPQPAMAALKAEPAHQEPVAQPARKVEPAASAEAKPAVPAPAQPAEQAAAQAAPLPQSAVAPTAQPASAADKIQNVNNAVDAARKISSFFH
jgi:hypothetical protein